MKRRSEDQILNSLLNEARSRDRATGREHSHAVQVVLPVSSYQQIDMLQRRNPRITRTTVLRRALGMYLMVVERAKRARPKRKT